jgi:membrane protease YdiL (CAAX protease family)
MINHFNQSRSIYSRRVFLSQLRGSVTINSSQLSYSSALPSQFCPNATTFLHKSLYPQPHGTHAHFSPHRVNSRHFSFISRKKHSSPSKSTPANANTAMENNKSSSNNRTGSINSPSPNAADSALPGSFLAQFFLSPCAAANDLHLFSLHPKVFPNAPRARYWLNSIRLTLRELLIFSAALAAPTLLTPTLLSRLFQWIAKFDPTFIEFLSSLDNLSLSLYSSNFIIAAAVALYCALIKFPVGELIRRILGWPRSKLGETPPPKFPAKYYNLLLIMVAVCVAETLGSLILSLFAAPSREDPMLIETMLTGQIKYILSTSIISPSLEELLFRGLLFARLLRFVGVWPAYLLSSVAFGAVHYSPDAAKVCECILAGAFFAFSYQFTGKLIIPIALHCLNNSLIAWTFKNISPLAVNQENQHREQHLIRFFALDDYISLLQYALKSTVYSVDSGEFGAEVDNVFNLLDRGKKGYLSYEEFIYLWALQADIVDLMAAAYSCIEKNIQLPIITPELQGLQDASSNNNSHNNANSEINSKNSANSPNSCNEFTFPAVNFFERQHLLENAEKLSVLQHTIDANLSDIKSSAQFRSLSSASQHRLAEFSNRGASPIHSFHVKLFNSYYSQVCRAYLIANKMYPGENSPEGKSGSQGISKEQLAQYLKQLRVLDKEKYYDELCQLHSIAMRFNKHPLASITKNSMLPSERNEHEQSNMRAAAAGGLSFPQYPSRIRPGLDEI